MRDLLCEKSAHRNYRALPTRKQERIKAALQEIAGEPKPTDHSKVTILEGPRTTVYRCRVGSHRVVFTVDGRYLKVWRVGERSHVYKGIDSTYDRVVEA